MLEDKKILIMKKKQLLNFFLNTLSLKLTSINLPKRLELLFRVVLAKN
jgi:hypothetical protein